MEKQIADMKINRAVKWAKRQKKYNDKKFKKTDINKNITGKIKKDDDAGIKGIQLSNEDQQRQQLMRERENDIRLKMMYQNQMQESEDNFNQEPQYMDPNWQEMMQNNNQDYEDQHLNKWNEDLYDGNYMEYQQNGYNQIDEQQMAS